jgi:hypothetical protein
MTAFVGRTLMAGDARPFVEDLDHLGGETDFQLLFDEGIGDGVVVPIDVHMIVNVNAYEFPLGILIGLGRERLESRTVERLKNTLTGAREFLKRPLVERLPELCDHRIEFREGEKRVVA